MPWRHPWRRDLTPSRALGSATLYVDPTNGNAATLLDLFPITTRVGMRLSLSHNSLSSRTGQLGQGWILSLNERLFNNDPTDLVYMDASGAEWVFTGAGPSYTRPAGLLATLKELSGGGWTLFDWESLERRTFNVNGWLTEIRDRNGNTLAIARNPSDEITSVATGDTGETVTLLDIFDYTAGRLTKIGRSACGEWAWALAYDGSSRLNLLTDPEGGTLALTYDGSSRLASITDWRGNATPSAIAIARDTMGRPTTVTYSANHNVVYAWDAMGRATSITSTGKDVANSDRVSSITTTAAGATVSTTALTWNARNQVVKERVQDGTPATTWERDTSWTAAGLRTKVDDLQEQWDSVFQHDPAGRLSIVQTTDNSGATSPNPFPWWEGDTRVSASPSGDVVSLVSGTSRIAYRYDEEHRLVEAEMASGDPVKVAYDGGGNLVSIVQGSATQKTLTHQGRILQPRNASDVLQDRQFWAGGHLMRVDMTPRRGTRDGTLGAPTSSPTRRTARWTRRGCGTNGGWRCSRRGLEVPRTRGSSATSTSGPAGSRSAPPTTHGGRNWGGMWRGGGLLGLNGAALAAAVRMGRGLTGCTQVVSAAHAWSYSKSFASVRDQRE